MSARQGTRTISQPQGAVPLALQEGANQPPGPRSQKLSRWVFWPAAAVIIVFVLLTTIFPAAATDLFGEIQGNVIKWFGWYYVAAISLFVIFALWIGLSRYGDIKLGKDDDEPEFSVMSWFALLLSVTTAALTPRAPCLTSWGACPAEPSSQRVPSS